MDGDLFGVHDRLRPGVLAPAHGDGNVLEILQKAFQLIAHRVLHLALVQQLADLGRLVLQELGVGRALGDPLEGLLDALEPQAQLVVAEGVQVDRLKQIRSDRAGAGPAGEAHPLRLGVVPKVARDGAGRGRLQQAAGDPLDDPLQVAVALDPADLARDLLPLGGRDLGVAQQLHLGRVVAGRQVGRRAVGLGRRIDPGRLWRRLLLLTFLGLFCRAGRLRSTHLIHLQVLMPDSSRGYECGGLIRAPADGSGRRPVYGQEL